jgi:transcriptional regulator with XRE-family HTH domain
MKDIPMRTAEHLGSAIRLKRKEKGLSQSALAGRLGVERKWVLRLEAGNPKAELGRVLEALDALGLGIGITDRDRARTEKKPRPASRLDEVFERLQRPSRK